MAAPDWKLEAEARRESLPHWYTLLEASRLCGYTSSTYLARQATLGKIISYKIGAYRLIPDTLAEALALKAAKKN